MGDLQDNGRAKLFVALLLLMMAVTVVALAVVAAVGDSWHLTGLGRGFYAGLAADNALALMVLCRAIKLGAPAPDSRDSSE